MFIVNLLFLLGVHQFLVKEAANAESGCHCTAPHNLGASVV